MPSHFYILFLLSQNKICFKKLLVVALSNFGENIFPRVVTNETPNSICLVLTSVVTLVSVLKKSAAKFKY